MGARKPTLGYPSRTAAVLVLKEKGHTRRQLAEMIGIDVKKVDHLLEGAARRKSPAEAEPVLRLPIRILASLQPHANRRGLSCTQLARQIVEVVTRENMVNAVLDDEDLLEEAS